MWKLKQSRRHFFLGFWKILLEFFFSSYTVVILELLVRSGGSAEEACFVWELSRSSATSGGRGGEICSTADTEKTLWLRQHHKEEQSNSAKVSCNPFLYIYFKKKSQFIVQYGHKFFSSRKERLLEISKARQKALEESVQLQKFLEDSYEVCQLKKENKKRKLLIAWSHHNCFCFSALMQNFYLIIVSLGNPLKFFFLIPVNVNVA